MLSPISVAILDNRQIEIDGIHYRLLGQKDIQIVGVARFGNHLIELLAQQPVNVLLVDKTTPTSPGQSTLFLIVRLLPDLLQAHPLLRVSVIASTASIADVQEARRQGAIAYILKGDQEAWVNLGQVIRVIAVGSFYYSPTVAALLAVHGEKPVELTPRQYEILSLLAAYPDMTTFEIALRLGVAHSTVRNQLSQAYWRLGVATRAAAIGCLRSLGQSGSLGKVERHPRPEDLR